MDNFELYSLALCFVVLVALTALFTTMIAMIAKYQLRLIRHGAEDEKIIKEYAAQKKRAEKQRGGWFVNLVYALFFGVFFAVFAFSIFAQVTEKNPIDGLPTLHVVKTSSMEEKLEKNKYLFENNLNDQIGTFDLIITHKLPDEFDLELYDIVVYEIEDRLIVHRIVRIEEPNATHPNERYFLLQGDNLESADRFPVHYSQMRAIYRGERIPFIGSFVLFMQTPAGWVCMLLVVLEMIAMPVVEKKLESAKAKRLEVIRLEKQAATAQNGCVVGQASTAYCAACPYYYCCYYCSSTTNGVAYQEK